MQKNHYAFLLYFITPDFMWVRKKKLLLRTLSPLRTTPSSPPRTCWPCPWWQFQRPTLRPRGWRLLIQTWTPGHRLGQPDFRRCKRRWRSNQTFAFITKKKSFPCKTKSVYLVLINGALQSRPCSWRAYIVPIVSPRCRAPLVIPVSVWEKEMLTPLVVQLFHAGWNQLGREVRARCPVVTGGVMSRQEFSCDPLGK